MQYYLVRDVADGTQPRVGSAIDPAGTPICDLKTSALSTLTHATASVIERRPGSDKLFSIGKDLLISAAARDVFQTTRLGDDLICIPVAIDGLNATRVTYYLVRSTKQYDVVDYDRSSFNYFRSEPTVRKNVKTYVLIGERVPKLDLFLTSEDDWRWIATERLVHAVVSSALSGFKFVPIWKG